MKYKLGARERLDVRNILPIEGGYKELKVTDRLHKLLAFSETEVVEWGIDQIGQKVNWNQEATREVEYDLNKEDVSLIVSQLKKLDKLGKITLQLIPLYDMFIGEN